MQTIFMIKKIAENGAADRFRSDKCVDETVRGKAADSQTQIEGGRNTGRREVHRHRFQAFLRSCFDDLKFLYCSFIRTMKLKD